MEQDVFGLFTNARTGKEEVVIVKSKARKHCIEVDGMTEEEFEEHWGYNIAGSKGSGQYSVIDDMDPLEVLQEYIEENTEVLDPHR